LALARRAAKLLQRCSLNLSVKIAPSFAAWAMLRAIFVRLVFLLT
jgi:hypothetical protein